MKNLAELCLSQTRPVDRTRCQAAVQEGRIGRNCVIRQCKNKPAFESLCSIHKNQKKKIIKYVPKQISKNDENKLKTIKGGRAPLINIENIIFTNESVKAQVNILEKTFRSLMREKTEKLVAENLSLQNLANY